MHKPRQLTFALMAAFQWFLTAFSVRPSSLRVMRAAAAVKTGTNNEDRQENMIW
jgi:hypothetical protein